MISGQVGYADGKVGETFEEQAEIAHQNVIRELESAGATAADLIKIAMIRIAKKMTVARLRSKMLLQVHDELIFDLHPDEEPQLKEILETEMVHAIDFKCPLEIDIGIGNNWLEAH